MSRSPGILFVLVVHRFTDLLSRALCRAVRGLHADVYVRIDGDDTYDAQIAPRIFERGLTPRS